MDLADIWNMKDESAIRKRYEMLKATLNERTLRLFAAAEARSFGYGGIAAVMRATGVSRSTIENRLNELDSPTPLDPSRIRRRGGGRKRATIVDPTLAADLESLVSPVTRGDPESPLRWTCKSVRKLAKELEVMGHKVSHALVASLLHEMGYSLQANRKTREGADHPDRNAQFEYINTKVQKQVSKGNPVISVDTKKKELIGDFKNAGREWHPQGCPDEVRVHDFMDKELGKAIPYGVYDLAKNEGWVSVGVDHDTAEFAVGTIRTWWKKMGKPAYHEASNLLIIADGGGSNGSRLRLWKWELQKLADRTGMSISVCHLPPGTSKWNKIEHRLFSFISQNWRGKTLLTHATIVNMISNTTTESGLKVRCELDRHSYQTKIKVSDEQMSKINIKPDDFHGDWNYTIRPNRNRLL